MRISNSPSRRGVLASAVSLGMAGMAGLAGGLRAQSGRRPNVVIFLADDSGWGDYSIHGNRNLNTPRIDSIGRDGALFDRFFVCPVCSPTRAEFLTGRYHPRGGVRGVSTGQERLNLDETTIAQTFKSAGYATAAFGKWHNGSQFPYHPNARGFDEYYGFTSGHWAEYFDTQMDHNGALTKGKGFIIDDLTDHAMAFIEQNKSKPFFCYLPYNTPHSPMQVPDKFYDRFAGKDVAMRATDPAQEDMLMTRAALAMVENLDWNVGRVLDKLKSLGLEGDTIVLYFSDNGPNSWRWNGGMKGRKGSTDEGGVRSPFLVRFPGRVKAGTRVPQIAGAIDILPTLADLCGVPLTSKKPLDGKSLRPLLEGRAGDWPDRMIFSHWNKRVSVRTQQYRLDAMGGLFDMVADPAQTKNIAAEKPEVTARLKKAVADWSTEVLPKGPDDRPYPVGYSKMTYLPARDGVGHGSIARSNTAPNSSYFTHWTNKDDVITWEIEVGQAGDYEAVVHYTCAAGDVNCKIEASFLGAKVARPVTEAFDPPLRGEKVDRVHRGSESYAKDWKELPLGVLKMAKGRGPLTLRALEIPGKQAIDVRYVILTRRGA